MKPLIGITCNHHRLPQTAPGPILMGAVSADDYAQGVEAAGGVPVLIPFVDTESVLQDIALRVDGLLLSGGDDVDPTVWGEEPVVGLGEVYPERDQLEYTLARACVAQGKPVFGICRGMQVINAAFGGTLYQDLAHQWHGRIQHSQRAPRNHLSHRVQLQPGSLVARLLENKTELRVNSFHHQAVRKVAAGFTAAAWDDEGLIEAIESAEHEFVVGVQWHPENLWSSHDLFLNLFISFITACTERA